MTILSGTIKHFVTTSKKFLLLKEHVKLKHFFNSSSGISSKFPWAFRISFKVENKLLIDVRWIHPFFRSLKLPVGICIPTTEKLNVMQLQYKSIAAIITAWKVSVFSPNAGKYGPEKLRIRTLSRSACLMNRIVLLSLSGFHTSTYRV